MWAQDYHQRLQDWQALRQSVEVLPLAQCLDAVNRWWFYAPWASYYLHWDDRDQWPDPWQLLHDNIFCSLARGLGIVYTLSLLARQDLQVLELAEVDNDNLVLIDGGKYVLNWDCDKIVNINPGPINPRRRVQQSSINQLIL